MNKSNDHRPHIVILGAGSIGCYLGGCLMAANARVTLIGRTRIQQQLLEHGLYVTDWQGRDSRIDADSINFSLSTSVLSEADFILVTVKGGDTEAAAQSIVKEAPSSAVIVSFQNGLRNAQILKQHLQAYKVIKGMVPFNVVSNGNGHFHCGTEGDMAIEGDNNALADLINEFKQAQLTLQCYEDLEGVQWGKLLMNLNNAVNALSGIPLRDQLYNKTYRKVMALIIKEALQTLKAANIKPARTGKVIPAILPYLLSLPTWLFQRVASATVKMDPTARSSMYEDLTLGRKTEIDFLNGEIVKLAKKFNVSSPTNVAIVKLIEQAEEKKSGSPMMKADELFRCVSTR